MKDNFDVELLKQALLPNTSLLWMKPQIQTI